MLVALLLLVGEDVDDMDLAAGSTYLVELLLVDDAVLGARAEENGQVKILEPVADGVRHAHERGNARAARECDDLLRVADAVVVKVPLGAGNCDLPADLPVILDVWADEARVVALDRDVVLAALCPCGGAAQRVGAGRDRAAYDNGNAYILPRPVRREGTAVLGAENDGLCVGAVGADIGNDYLLPGGVTLLCLLVGGESLGKGRR